MWLPSSRCFYHTPSPSVDVLHRPCFCLFGVGKWDIKRLFKPAMWMVVEENCTWWIESLPDMQVICGREPEGRTMELHMSYLILFNSNISRTFRSFVPSISDGHCAYFSCTF